MTAEEKKTLRQVTWRTFQMNVGNNKVVSTGRNFGYSVYPAIDLYYTSCATPEANLQRKQKAFLRYTEQFFNTQTVFFSMIVGVAMAMEKQNGALPEEENIDSAIDSVKSSLMGPCAGIGDSLFKNVLLVVFSSVCIGIGANGSILAPILFLLGYGGILAALKIILCRMGFVYGVSIIDKAFESGLIPIITKAGCALGSIMVGTLIANNVKVAIKLAPEINGAVIDIQGVLDSFFPGILSLGMWALVVFLMKKKWKPMNIIWLIMAGCVLLAAIKVF